MSTTLRRAKPQTAPSTVPPRRGRRRMSARSSGASVWLWASIPAAASTPTQRIPARSALRSIAGAAGEVEDERARGEAERGDGASPPAGVEAEGEHPVEEVVAAGDPVEHRSVGPGPVEGVGGGRRAQAGHAISTPCRASRVAATSAWSPSVKIQHPTWFQLHSFTLCFVSA